MDLLQNYKLRQTITNYNGQNLNIVHSFVSANDGNTGLYYVMNYFGSNILVYNEYWEYQRNLNLSAYPVYSVYTNYQTYIVLNSMVIQKYNKYLNESIQSSIRVTIYRGLYLNATNGLIYVANCYNNSISIFDQNLTFLGNFSTFFGPFL